MPTEQRPQRPTPIPHDTTDEAALLGAALLVRRAAEAVANRTGPGDYWDPYHRRVRDAIADLVGAGDPVEVQTVASDLARRNGVENLAAARQRLGGLVSACGASSHWESYLRSVHEWAYRRRILSATSELKKAAEHGDPLALELARKAVVDIQTPARHTMRRWTMDELLAEEERFDWLAKGLLAHPTYGMLGGPRKTLKTYVLLFIALGVAAGRAIFDQFEIPGGPANVVFYCGEGGRTPMKRRMRRVAQAIGVDLADIPLHPYFDVAPLNSPLFVETLRSDLEELRPALVVIDPLYSFHPADVKASSLYEEGALLAAVSAPCSNAGCSLIIGNHFNKSGVGTGLDRITQAGGQEWSDTWMLLSHREKADVDEGRFKLRFDVGSRQWGGGDFDIDLTIGTFDVDRGEFDGPITWTIGRHQNDEPEGQGPADMEILDVVSDMPWAYTRTQIKEIVRGNTGRFNKAWKELRETGLIVAERVPRTEGGRTMARDVWAPAGTPRPPVADEQQTLGGSS